MPRRRWEHWEQVSYFTWIRVFSRLPLSSTTKLIGYALAVNATANNGHDAHPGIDLLMTQTGLSSKQTIITHLGILRDTGLIERQFQGKSAGRRGLADMYYLVLHNDARIAAGVKPCECSNGDSKS